VSREVDIAWAAGIFEGEGTWCVTKGRSACARMGMRDRDVVERFALIVGFGSIYTNVRPNPKHNDVHYWQVYNAPQVRALIRMFSPYLGIRRMGKAQEILDATEGIGSEGRSKYAVMAAAGMDWN
jgi:hypothetical protein